MPIVWIATWSATSAAAPLQLPMSMNLSTLQIVSLVLAWAGYGLIHSLLASLWLKRRVTEHWPSAPRYYRLAFNALALAFLAPPLYLMYHWAGDPLWQWRGTAFWVANGLALLALLGFFWTLRDYDTAEFLGTRQWRRSERRIEDQESLHISTLHRYVRHPWYFLALVLVWTRDMDGALLISAICITVYFVLGSMYEERKLLIYHGDAYKEYMRRVPGLIPWPGRHLSPTEAKILTKKYRDAIGPGTE